MKKKEKKISSSPKVSGNEQKGKKCYILDSGRKNYDECKGDCLHCSYWW